MLRPGEKTLPLRQTASLLVAPFEGKGYSIIDGKRFDWNQFDTLAVPGGSWCEHRQRFGYGAGLSVRGQRRADAQEACRSTSVGPDGFGRCREACCERPGAGQKGALTRDAAGVEHKALVAHRLSGRRPGLGRGQRRCISATCATPAARRSSTSPIRATAPHDRAIDVPDRLAFAQGAGARTTS